jgi:DNA-directed RNA polymerase specialized sigma24 family protein
VKLLSALLRFISESRFQGITITFGREEAMNDAQQRGERTVMKVYDEHAPMLFRIAFTYLKNQYDSEDALQECFLRYLRSRPSLSDPQHEKA